MILNLKTTILFLINIKGSSFSWIFQISAHSFNYGKKMNKMNNTNTTKNINDTNNVNFMNNMNDAKKTTMRTIGKMFMLALPPLPSNIILFDKGNLSYR